MVCEALENPLSLSLSGNRAVGCKTQGRARHFHEAEFTFLLSYRYDEMQRKLKEMCKTDSKFC